MNLHIYIPLNLKKNKTCCLKKKEIKCCICTLSSFPDHLNFIGPRGVSWKVHQVGSPKQKIRLLSTYDRSKNPRGGQMKSKWLGNSDEVQFLYINNLIPNIIILSRHWEREREKTPISILGEIGEMQHIMWSHQLEENNN